ALRARLAQEGFPSDPPAGQADRFEQTLFMALGHFQRVHQIAVAPRVGRDTRAALRMGAQRKLAAIHRALHDWRATAPRDPAGLYVQINVADFHGEVWRAGARLHRFRVIVGDDTPAEDGRVPNATPEIHSQIHQVVFNPDWRVPQRILEDEILPRAVEQQGYQGLDELLAARGFEVVHRGTAAEHVRQRPGRGNPLGQVKFRFPNPYAIYLHDTPRRGLFQRPRRALSHGCVRVERPLHLARLLLEHDNRYDPQAVREWLSGEEPHTVTLTRPVPIHIDDIGVRVDDAGRAHFLADLYGRRAHGLSLGSAPPSPPAPGPTAAPTVDPR
ncbi:MAG: L,D-transpeptidase family protein, partial [Myxococcales bacterium]|nr:L,D-transpeptidase family protein [Myxococcales bacterium]